MARQRAAEILQNLATLLRGDAEGGVGTDEAVPNEDPEAIRAAARQFARLLVLGKKVG
jgi:hypothetical protein